MRASCWFLMSLLALPVAACRNAAPGITANCQTSERCGQLQPPSSVDSCIEEEQARIDKMNEHRDCEDAARAYDALAACSAQLQCADHDFNGVSRSCEDELTALSQAGGANCGR